jgi:hypothetical protein
MVTESRFKNPVPMFCMLSWRISGLLDPSETEPKFRLETPSTSSTGPGSDTSISEGSSVMFRVRKFGERSMFMPAPPESMT